MSSQEVSVNLFDSQNYEKLYNEVKILKEMGAKTENLQKAIGLFMQQDKKKTEKIENHLFSRK